MTHVPKYRLTLKQLQTRVKRFATRRKPEGGARLRRYRAEETALGQMHTVKTLLGGRPLPVRIRTLQRRIERLKNRLDYRAEWGPTWKEFRRLNVSMYDEIDKIFRRLGVPSQRRKAKRFWNEWFQAALRRHGTAH